MRILVQYSWLTPFRERPGTGKEYHFGDVMLVRMYREEKRKSVPSWASIDALPKKLRERMMSLAA